MADGLLLKRRVFELDRSVLASENASEGRKDPCPDSFPALDFEFWIWGTLVGGSAGSVNSRHHAKLNMHVNSYDVRHTQNYKYSSLAAQLSATRPLEYILLYCY